MPEDWKVYLIRCRDNSLYTGIAKNIESRVEQHNSGKASKYTRTRRPVTLVYLEKADSRGEALRREKVIKGMKHEEKLGLLKKSLAIPIWLAEKDPLAKRLKKKFLPLLHIKPR